MTNRARPTWPEGADSSKSQRPAPSEKQSTPASPPSNGRSGATPSGNGQRPAAELRPQQQRPGTAGAPVRPAQQPPVRPAAQPGTTRSTPTPSTPSRPEPWSPTTPAAGKPVDSESAYGLTGRSTGVVSKTETFGDKVSAARQAVLDKAAAVTGKSDDTDSVEFGDGSKAAAKGQTRKARLRMSRIDPWSVMKTAFLLSIAFGIVTWVAVFIVWSAIGAAGVFDNINSTVTEVLGNPNTEPFRIENYINTGKVMGFTTLLACADVLIITALATLGSFLYNIAATLLGGLEVTLASED
ncbi:hypothetical protein E1263_35710 [Kribbella antibiotica]|uniref:DUF3566 domain-containing protein n=1 Tax=Kribbella antibiotica TaxID=190195 RepID=A0A4R4YP46_9ACTN|nr:DUF3566 domain-containing protein [Kribbella antibiotica]TDD46856.1 hypothetical protein E1263_35710 [Kribbella antibiotica]